MKKGNREVIVDQERRIIKLERALPDPNKLRLLADWLDLKYPSEDVNVQLDLRRWARQSEEAQSPI